MPNYFKESWAFEDRKQFLNLPFPMSEYERRVAAVKKQMEEDGLDAVIVLSDKRVKGNIRYLTNFYPMLGHSALFVPLQGDLTIVTTASAHGEPMHSFVPDTWVPDVRVSLFRYYKSTPSFQGHLENLVNEHKLEKGRIGIVGWGLLGYEYFTGLKNSFPDIQWSDWLHGYELVKSKKSDLELAVIKRAAEISDEGMFAAFKAAKPGVTETEVAGAFDYAVRKGGMDSVAYHFDTRVCSGPRSILKNSNPTDRVLQKGDMFFIDVSCTYKGYVIDVSSSSVIDADPTKEELNLLETAARMTEEMVKSSKAGFKAADLCEITKGVAEEMGELDVYCDYMAGHGLGCDQLEIPHIYPDSPDILDVGMCYSTEPMVLCPKRGTGTIEQVCMVEKNNGVFLTKFPLRPWTKSW